MTYPAFPKIARLSKLHWSITEKLDGTNGQVYITPKDATHPDDVLLAQHDAVWENTDWVVRAGSRSRWLTPGIKGGDNFGFGQWVYANAPELINLLGPGAHFGEWWGQGIQRGYDQQERRFTVFNPHRYPHLPFADNPDAGGVCVDKVPLLASGSSTALLDYMVLEATERLTAGSVAAPGYTRAEGFIVTIERTNYKVIINDGPKEATRG